MIKQAIIALFAVCIAGCSGSATEGDPVFKTDGPPRNVYIAALQGDLEAARGFIENVAWDANEIDAAGFTPLTCAAKGGNAEIIKLMVENGADINQIDAHKDTPLMVANREGKDNAAAALKELGATAEK